MKFRLLRVFWAERPLGVAAALRGRHMLKSVGFAPIAAALVGVAVLVVGSQVRAGGDKVGYPEGFDKSVKFTTVDRAEVKQFRELYTSPTAIDAAKKGQPLPSGPVCTMFH